MLIIGCGDIGRRVSLIANPERDIHAIVSRPESAAKLQALGIHALNINFDHDIRFPDIPPQAQWFYFMPPQKSGTGDERLKKWLDCVPPCVPENHLPARVVYISTSGVYGDHQGNWVDENTPPNPQTARAIRRVDAEQQWQVWCAHHQIDLLILRVPGIVGSGRSMAERLKTGEPILHPDDSPYTNLIDADELAKICLHLSAKAPAGIYNVANNETPKTATEHYLKICEEEGLKIPPFIRLAEAEKHYSPMRMSFIRESRRLNIDKLKSVYSFTNNQ